MPRSLHDAGQAATGPTASIMDEIPKGYRPNVGLMLIGYLYFLTTADRRGEALEAARAA